MRNFLFFSTKGGHPPSGSLFEHGYHIISYTAIDVHGNMAVCSFGFRVTGKSSR